MEEEWLSNELIVMVVTSIGCGFVIGLVCGLCKQLIHSRMKIRKHSTGMALARVHEVMARVSIYEYGNPIRTVADSALHYNNYDEIIQWQDGIDHFDTNNGYMTILEE